ncbi:hypothetical protein ALC62_10184 [Cyphomyrmex costatus]|uniref:Uncharacterized protein n=1 Tax=Cyphomyrmex costatus TaxID=456900 RepID=A0A195CED8_9HYME|nr:hypothetical protein ALC62_10184 [Cyphomyrmex costatus]
MFFKMVLHVQSDQRMASPYRASSFSRARRIETSQFLSCDLQAPPSKIISFARKPALRRAILSLYRYSPINSLQVGLAATGRIYEPCTFRENDGPKTKLCALYVLSWKSAERASTSDYAQLCITVVVAIAVIVVVTALPASKLKAAYPREALDAFEQTSRDSRAKCNFEDERRTLSIQDPSKLGSFDLESLSDVAGYGIRQRSFAPVKVPVSRGKGSWRRPFSLFLEFYLSGVGYLRLRRGIRGRGCNTGRGKIRQDVERSSSVTAAKFRPQSLKESLVSQQPTAVQLSCIQSCSLLSSWQSRELRLRHARTAADTRDGQRSKKTKRQMRKCGTSIQTGIQEEN